METVILAILLIGAGIIALFLFFLSMGVVMAGLKHWRDVWWIAVIALCTLIGQAVGVAGVGFVFGIRLVFVVLLSYFLCAEFWKALNKHKRLRVALERWSALPVYKRVAIIVIALLLIPFVEPVYLVLEHLAGH